MRRAANIDKNQTEIVRALRQLGVAVEIIKQPVDLLVCFRGVTSLMEVKNPNRSFELTKDQVEFIARWPGKIDVVKSVDEAIRALVGDEVLR